MTATSPDTPLRELIDLSGRTAVVTGGAMGIGLGIARRLHEAGASVAIADLDLGAAEHAADELEALRPGSALAVRTDVSHLEGVETMVAEAVERFGGLDVQVNNAGIFPMAPLAELDLDMWRHVIDVNLTGLFLCTKVASERMKAQGGGGTIINVTSIDALHPSSVGLAHYDASKHGVWGFTKNVALELAEHGIRVNAIAPGGIHTPGTGDTDPEMLATFAELIPMRRMGEPDDIGRVALFLASDLAAYMTGAQVVVDGGRLLR